MSAPPEVKLPTKGIFPLIQDDKGVCKLPSSRRVS
nr:MAG TPA: hypothetical protein [Caudoviricetes sp.]